MRSARHSTTRKYTGAPAPPCVGEEQQSAIATALAVRAASTRRRCTLPVGRAARAPGAWACSPASADVSGRLAARRRWILDSSFRRRRRCERASRRAAARAGGASTWGRTATSHSTVRIRFWPPRCGRAQLGRRGVGGRHSSRSVLHRLWFWRPSPKPRPYQFAPQGATTEDGEDVL